jgi:sugar/nucleoside kinase (ribokinase family)
MVSDTVGAGDAFFAIASLCAGVQAPLEMSCFLASVAGALASNILGNAQPVERVKLLKYAATLMKY